jgi:anthranilate phosphoribosyltransferase
MMENSAIRKSIACLVAGGSLSESEAAAAMHDVMENKATSAQIGAFLAALSIKGESVDEITGLAKVMRKHAVTIDPGLTTLIDTCGTGGDGSHTFNISTTTAFVVAGAGVPVAKHGNRAASSQCGSADVLEALGVNINLRPDQVEESIRQVGMGFLFAQVFHGAMKHAAAPRRELGIRTVFNLLGPLANPANANIQILGVYHRSLTALLAEVLGRLGVEEAYVVHGLDCLDEISISGPTQISHLEKGQVKTYLVSPTDANLPCADRHHLIGGNALTNAQITLNVLRGERGPCRDVVLLNAAAALIVAGAAHTLSEGVLLAASTIDSGLALQTLYNLRDYSNGCSAA